MKISLVVPVYNEESAIPIFYKAVNEELDDLNLEIIFINDGSSDSTEALIDNLSNQDQRIKAINLTRNFGKEPALMAGLESATGDAIIPIDVDLQDPIEVIPQLIEKWKEGHEVVLAKRIDRSSDSRLKRITATWFYRIHNKISNIKIEENVGDFRLISKNVCDSIVAMPERGLFMKGLLSWVTDKQAIVTYKREERCAGETKFNGWKLWNLAIEGITSFSTIPLRLWTYFGLTVSLASIIYGSIMIIDKLINGNPIPGYPSLLVSILFLGGVQLIGIGVLGEYLGRVYLEVKQRPRFLAKDKKYRKQDD
jgi:glycosyltransferase involved in cell wall biosynthesis